MHFAKTLLLAAAGFGATAFAAPIAQDQQVKPTAEVETVNRPTWDPCSNLAYEKRLCEDVKHDLNLPNIAIPPHDGKPYIDNGDYKKPKKQSDYDKYRKKDGDYTDYEKKGNHNKPAYNPTYNPTYNPSKSRDY